MMNQSEEVRQRMHADEPADPAPGSPPRTLADKVEWLISHAHPAGRGPYSNAEAAALIEKTTGQQISHTTIWKLRNGQATNPQMRLIEALATTFGVAPAYFFDNQDEKQTGLMRDQAELLALLRDTNVPTAQLRTILQLTPQALQALTDLIQHTTHNRQP